MEGSIDNTQHRKIDPNISKSTVDPDVNTETLLRETKQVNSQIEASTSQQNASGAQSCNMHKYVKCEEIERNDEDMEDVTHTAHNLGSRMDDNSHVNQSATSTIFNAFENTNELHSTRTISNSEKHLLNASGKCEHKNVGNVLTTINKSESVTSYTNDTEKARPIKEISKPAEDEKRMTSPLDHTKHDSILEISNDSNEHRQNECSKANVVEPAKAEVLSKEENNDEMIKSNLNDGFNDVSMDDNKLKFYNRSSITLLKKKLVSTFSNDNDIDGGDGGFNRIINNHGNPSAKNIATVTIPTSTSYQSENTDSGNVINFIHNDLSKISLNKPVVTLTDKEINKKNISVIDSSIQDNDCAYQESRDDITLKPCNKAIISHNFNDAVDGGCEVIVNHNECHASSEALSGPGINENHLKTTTRSEEPQKNNELKINGDLNSIRPLSGKIEEKESEEEECENVCDEEIKEVIKASLEIGKEISLIRSSKFFSTIGVKQEDASIMEQEPKEEGNEIKSTEELTTSNSVIVKEEIEGKLAVMLHGVVDLAQHDDASRSSIASTLSSSSATSSLHQLVIDHRIDDTMIASAIAPTEVNHSTPRDQHAQSEMSSDIDDEEEMDAEEDSESAMAPLRLNLKRKLSGTYMRRAVKHGRFQCNDYGSPSNNILLQQSPPPLPLQLPLTAQLNLTPLSTASPALRMSNNAAAAHLNAEIPDTDSLLLKHLQPAYKSITGLSSGDHNNDDDEACHVHVDELSTGLTNTTAATPISMPISNTTLICFKCKMSNFKSLLAFYNHLDMCLVDELLHAPPLDEHVTVKKNKKNMQPQPVNFEEFPEFRANTLPQHMFATAVSPHEKVLEYETENANPNVMALKATAIARTSAPIMITKSTNITAISDNTQIKAVHSKQRYYKCSTCGTHHESWHFFLHVREKHGRYMCLYCIRFFPTAEKLSLHLEIKHDLEQNHYNSEASLRQGAPVHSFEYDSVNDVLAMPKETRFLMCCTCQHVFIDTEPFTEHSCSDYIKPCMLCGKKGRHSNHCKARPDVKVTSVAKMKKQKSKTLKTDPSSLLSAQQTSIMMMTSMHNIPLEGQSSSFHQHSLPSVALHCDSSSNIPLSAARPAIIASNNINSTSTDNLLPDMPLAHPINELMASTDKKRKLIQDGELQDDQKQPALVVPKFKLRVPKEFQKSVDAALSSTDSDDDGEDDAADDIDVDSTDDDDDQDNNLKATDILIHAHTNNLFKLARTNELQKASTIGAIAENVNDDKIQPRIASVINGDDDDEDSLQESNSNLIRLMEEIERTKLDIQRTKDECQNAKEKNAATALLHREDNDAITMNLTNDNDGVLHHHHNRDRKNWSPTPPASPHSRHSHIEISTADDTAAAAVDAITAAQQEPNTFSTNAVVSDTNTTPPPPLVSEAGLPLYRGIQRRDTIGSDIMDIDESISCNQVQILAKSEEYKQEEGSQQQQVSIVNQMMSGIPAIASSSTINACSSIGSGGGDGVGASGDAKGLSQLQHENSDPLKYEIRQKSPIVGIKSPNVETATRSDDGNAVATLALAKAAAPADGIEIASEDTPIIELQLDRALEKYAVVDFVRICLSAVYSLCLYCNHARRIAVSAESLVLHLIAQHRFSATVDSITAEELMPETIMRKLKSFLPMVKHDYLNAASYCTIGDGAHTDSLENERIFECFQCRFVATTHKELYLHNRKMHLRTAILCFMCRANFFSFSEILCHMCPGAPYKSSTFDVPFRCCLCAVDNIPSPFRLMVHLRRQHCVCDVCLEDCREQNRLSSHVWKHKLHHVCYRCGIAYRNKMDITKHLFWKHGTESIICKRCMQKRWRHVYHFCVPPTAFVCDVCNLCFTRAMYLKVHKRIHTGDFRYPCSEENCEEKFISRKLLLKHAVKHQFSQSPALPPPLTSPPLPQPPSPSSSLAAAPLTTITQENAALDLKEGSAAGRDCDCNKRDVTKHLTCLACENNESKPNAFELKSETRESDIKKSIEVIKDETTLSNTSAAEKVTQKHKNKFYLETSAGDKLGDSSENKFSLKSGEISSPTFKKQNKKSKRTKLSLDDLNLIAPNLSESDSSSNMSDCDSKSRFDDALVPNVMLSPPSEADDEEDMKLKASIDPRMEETSTLLDSPTISVVKVCDGGMTAVRSGEPVAGNVLQIWKNLLQAQQGNDDVNATQSAKSEVGVDTGVLAFHVARSDHDYCTMHQPQPPPPPTTIATPQLSPMKNASSTSKLPRRHNSSRRSHESSTSSDGGDSSSDSNSSCSCGSNCSCSSSGSDSSSTSNSSNDSNSSIDSNLSRVKRHRKKSERDRMRKKSLSSSPIKKHNICNNNTAINTPLLPNDITGVGKDGGIEENGGVNVIKAEHKVSHRVSPLPPEDITVATSAAKALMDETDLETAESDTDEEFYDEHPQKLASELLAEKRAQLMAQTLLSPSHNFDIVENSRPSTPSLPEEVAVSVGKLSKQKKKKRERRSSSKVNLKPKINHDTPAMITATDMAVSSGDGTGDFRTTSSFDDPFLILQSDLCGNMNLMNSQTPLPLQPALPTRPMLPHLTSHLSEGSSCSDMDSSLKRSKRTRRPNKFYGYTSDDDTAVGIGGFGQSLVIGARTFKPTPPPQLTWRKEDLPPPSKSILHGKANKSRGSKAALKTDASNASALKRADIKKKRQRLTDKSVNQKSQRTNGSTKHTVVTTTSKNNRMPIPTLKIRSSQIAALGGSCHQQPQRHNVLHYDKQNSNDYVHVDGDDNDDDDDEEDDNEDSSESSSDNEEQQMLHLQQQQMHQISATELWRTALQLHAAMPAAVKMPSTVIEQRPQAVPAPQTTVFNHKIPPALLPNPDFTTLQYFKANNIRYPIRPPAGARQARDGESVYCYCRCPYDEVSEMIACDGENCLIEWFHFECVGIMVAPQGKWFCAECRPQYSEELYPATSTHNSITSNTNNSLVVEGAGVDKILATVNSFIQSTTTMMTTTNFNGGGSIDDSGG